MNEKSIFDLDGNLAAAASYIIGPISGIVVLIMERKNKFVRFHALQSTIWFFMLWVVIWLVGLITALFTGIPIIGFIFGLILWPVRTALIIAYVGSKIFLMYKAYMGAVSKVPVVGEVAWTQVNK